MCVLVPMSLVSKVWLKIDTKCKELCGTELGSSQGYVDRSKTVPCKPRHLVLTHHWCTQHHQYSTRHCLSAAWAAVLLLTSLAMQTASPVGFLPAISWNSGNLRGCEWNCHAPPPSRVQWGCNFHSPRPPGCVCTFRKISGIIKYLLDDQTMQRV